MIRFGSRVGLGDGDRDCSHMALRVIRRGDVRLNCARIPGNLWFRPGFLALGASECKDSGTGGFVSGISCAGWCWVAWGVLLGGVVDVGNSDWRYRVALGMVPNVAKRH